MFKDYALLELVLSVVWYQPATGNCSLNSTYAVALRAVLYVDWKRWCSGVCGEISTASL